MYVSLWRSRRRTKGTEGRGEDEGDGTIDQRLALFKRQREALIRQMTALQNTLDMLDYKCWFYERAQELGSIEAVKDLDGDALPERFQGVRRS
ncbi:MAG: hypothetical protein MR399_04105, partial [Clostridiales bacterium]|nr:hypothetical protein [Clostridiales bacterium]